MIETETQIPAISTDQLHRAAEARRRRARMFPYLMSLPAALAVVAIVVYPMAYAVYVSFTPFHLLRPDTTRIFEWSSMFDNYVSLLKDEIFWRALKNTVVFLAITVNLEIVAGLGIALMMARMTVMRGVSRTLLMVPMMFAPVLIGFQFGWFFNATVGLVNNLFIQLGWMTDPKPWLVDQPTGMIALMLATVWMNTPVVAVIVLAGRLSLPGDVYEAATMDGANPWQQFSHITLPLIRPFLIIAMTILALDLSRAYDIVRIMTGGGPAHRTELLWTYGGRLAIRNSQFGLASAMSMFGVVLGVATAYYLFRQMLRARETTE